MHGNLGPEDKNRERVLWWSVTFVMTLFAVILGIAMVA